MLMIRKSCFLFPTQVPGQPSDAEKESAKHGDSLSTSMTMCSFSLAKKSHAVKCATIEKGKSQVAEHFIHL